MKINRKKVITRVLYYLALSSMTMGACSTRDTNSEEIVEVVIDPSIDEIIANVIEEVTIEEEETPTIEKPKKEEKDIDEDSIEYNSKVIHTVITDSKVIIRKENSEDSEKMGIYPEGREFELLSNQDSEWYKINYYGKEGYISKHYSHESIKRVMTIPIIDKGFLIKSDTLYTNKLLRIEKKELNRHEFVRIYKEFENCYMVSTTEGLGFVKKDNIELVAGNMVEADISDQELRLYAEVEDHIEGKDIVLLEARMISGTKDSPKASEQGFFTVHCKYQNPRYIVPGAWVENGVFYNRDDGMHDSSRWRKDYEYGGTTYYRNGSSGCLNLSLENSKVIDKYMELGDKVLVKE